MGTCANCGTDFAPRPSRARYCSNACRQQAYRKRVAGTSTVVADLPVYPDGFVGRDRELTELVSLLRKHRLLTLVGAAGVGKTRLAVELAHSSRKVEVRTVALGKLSRPDQVVQAFAEAVGAYQHAGVALRTTLLQELRSRRMLLLVDNCEHLVEECCALVDALLSRCPGVQVLATSREALRAIGEAVYPVQGLDADAAGLFAERAEMQPDQHERATIEAICARLDGVPLAVELAARLARTVPLTEIEDHLHRRLDLLAGTEGEQRHRSLRAAVEWSHDLLTVPEQELFRRLALLPGGFGLGIAQVVHGGAVISLLSALTAKSLVVRENDGRFRMLESMRLYAEERLREHGEFEVTAERIVDWLSAIGESGIQLSILTEEQIAMQHQEYDNVAYAYAHLVAAHDERRLPLVTILLRVCFQRGYFAEAGQLLMEALDSTPADSRYRGLALEYASLYAGYQRRFGDAVKCATEAVEVAVSLGQHQILCRMYRTLASAHLESGDVAEAINALRRSVEYGVRNGDESSVAVTRQNLSWCLLATGQSDEAETTLAQAVPVLRAHSRPDIVATALHTWGCVALERGDLVAAGARFAEGLRQNASARALHESVEGSAVVAVLTGRHELGVRLLVACATIRETWGWPHEPWWSRKIGEALDVAREALSRTAFSRAESAGRAMDERHVLESALDNGIVRHEELSDRQRVVVELVAQGMTNAQIAARLGISHRTVESHVQNVKTVLDLSTRAQLVAWAQSN